jgi:hypothetical protein
MNRFVITFAASHNVLRMPAILKVACPHSSRWFTMKKTALPRSEFRIVDTTETVALKKQHFHAAPKSWSRRMSLLG